MKIDLSRYKLFKDHNIENLTLIENQGCSNKNYTFIYNKSTYLLRKFILKDRYRELEYEVQTLAFKNGIAAEPLILDLKNSLMICHFLEGHHKEKLQTQDIKSMADILCILHSLSVNKKTINIKKKIKKKNKCVKDAFAYIDSCENNIALCHNDINTKNCIFLNTTLKLIDWEFADMNDIYFDLASITVEYDLNLREEYCLLYYYFGVDDWNKNKLDAYKVIYKNLCTQWFKDNL